MTTSRRPVPKKIYRLPLGGRIRWARKSAGLSHDRLVAKIGRSNRGHLIKIEQGVHTPGPDLRNVIADATGVPRELFDDEDDEESDPMASLAQNVTHALMAAVYAAVAKSHDPIPIAGEAAGTGSQTKGA